MTVRPPKAVLLLGMGGGGDVVSCVHLSRLFRLMGSRVVLGSVPYERPLVDPTPGPVSVGDLKGALEVGDHWALAGPGTTAVRGGREFRPQAVRLSSVLGEPVYLVDLYGGPRGVTAALKEIAEREGLDAVVGVDAGGDVLAVGGEEGLVSPLADQTVLASLGTLDMDAYVAVHGPGCDGELDPDYVLSRVFKLGPPVAYWGITEADIPILERILEVVETEASRLPLLAAKGIWGKVKIREGRRKVFLSSTSAMTFLLEAKRVYGESPMARAISGCADLDCVLNILRKMGVKTEYDLELEGKS